MWLQPGNRTEVVVDLSNVVARAVAIAQDQYLGLFVKMMVRMRRRFPTYGMVYALEHKGTDARRKILPAYKLNRVPSDEFNQARNTVIAMLHNTACCTIQVIGGEADDAIGTYLNQNPGEYIVLTNDRDVWQCCGPSVRIESKVGKSTVLIDPFACRRIFGTSPEAIPLAKAMLGDTSDGIARAIPKVPKAKLLRLAETATTADQIPSAMAKSKWLTPHEKKLIQTNLTAVKQNEQVTRIWKNLILTIHSFKGDKTKLNKFLQQCSVEEDGSVLIGGSK